jgi:hypothetical protein
MLNILDFGNNVIYASIFIILAFVPTIMSFRNRYYFEEKSILLSLLSLISTVGIFFFLIKAWSFIPSNGFWEYLEFAVFSLVLVSIPIVNIGLMHEEKSTFNIFINGVLVLPAIWAIYSTYTAFSLPLNGFVEYFVFVCFFCLLFLASIAYLYINFDRYSMKSNVLYGFPGIIFLSFTLYSLERAIESIPSIYFYGAALGILIVLGMTFGANEY